jgi:cysteinyl-tRNA synthetase
MRFSMETNSPGERRSTQEDRIRQELLDRGIVPEDGAQGATWRRA